MKQGNIIQLIQFLLLFTVLQLTLFKNILLLDYASCFIYIGFILLLPIHTTLSVSMLMAFGLGLLMDVFYNTPGINASASILVAYLRDRVIRLLTPAGGYDGSAVVSVSYLGFIWFIKYATLLIFVHHFYFFALESWDLSRFFEIMLRTICSSLFTLGILTMIQYLLIRKD
jgi:rod shape-determining protein MreD